MATAPSIVDNRGTQLPSDPDKRLGVGPQPLRSRYCLSDWLLWEVDDIGRISRENCSVAPNQDLVTGTVLMRSVENPELVVPVDAGGIAVGILCEDVLTGADPAGGAMITRHARIGLKALTWLITMDAAARVAALTELAKQDVLPVREV